MYFKWYTKLHDVLQGWILTLLITNDDGINAPGLWAAVNHLQSFSKIIVVAPADNQSGTGASISLKSPVKLIKKINYKDNVQVFSVEGTPSDCVILACEKILKNKPELIISGINSGANLGLDVMLSGTVGAAIHGYLRNIPSIAISVSYKKKIRFDIAGLMIQKLVSHLNEIRYSKPLLLNVNVPSVELKKIKSLKSTFLGGSNYQQNVEQEKTSHETFYWIKSDKKIKKKPSEGSDIWAIDQNHISITKIEPFFSSSSNDSDILYIIDSINKKYF